MAGTGNAEIHHHHVSSLGRCTFALYENGALYRSFKLKNNFFMVDVTLSRVILVVSQRNLELHPFLFILFEFLHVDGVQR